MYVVQVKVILRTELSNRAEDYSLTDYVSWSNTVEHIESVKAIKRTPRSSISEIKLINSGVTPPMLVNNTVVVMNLTVMTVAVTLWPLVRL